ncbi:MAG: hypothetical protein KDA45_03915 [Planctomycetales bacterium]|nr:hypothetical protein [Planctomycetales bacterium]
MPIEFACESCTKLLRVPDGSGGRSCECPACGALLEIPDPAAITKVEVRRATAEADEALHKIPCPKCHLELVCPASLLGTKGQCRHCKYIFLISDTPGSAGTAVEALASGWIFRCPSCNQLFEGQPEMRGRKGKCHACGEVFAIELQPAEKPELDTQFTAGRVSPDGGSSASAKPASPRSAARQLAKQQPANFRPRERATSQFSSTATQRLTCTKCGGLMEVPAAAGGQPTACPYCQQRLLIPHVDASTTAKRPAGRRPGGAAEPTPDHSSSGILPSAVKRENGGAESAIGDAWNGMGDFRGKENPYALPPANRGGRGGRVRSGKRLHGLSFSHAFELTFQSLFPSCFWGVLLFGATVLASAVLVVGAKGISYFGTQFLHLQPESWLYLGITLAPMVLAGAGVLLLTSSAICMLCNTALHAVRGQQLDIDILLGIGNGRCFGGVLALLFVGTLLNLFQKLGLPLAAELLIAAGYGSVATVLGIAAVVLLALLQLGLFLMFTSVPFALLDGESLGAALRTSTAIFFGNAFTIAGIILCGMLLYVAVSIASLGLGFLALLGAPAYLYAAIYHLGKP